MAKRKRSNTAEMPPGVEATETHEVVVEPPPAVEETQTVVAKLQRLTVTVPSVDLGMAGYQSNRVDVQNLTGRQRATLKCVVRGLEENEAKLANGKVVKGYSDAIKYLLENLA